jgi:hypothetical protein
MLCSRRVQVIIQQQGQELVERMNKHDDDPEQEKPPCRLQAPHRLRICCQSTMTGHSGSLMASITCREGLSRLTKNR